jgi:hypothetical protein
VGDFELDAGQLTLLGEALRSLDRADQARVIVDTEGAVVWDRCKTPKAHPMIAVERDSRTLSTRLFRELVVDPRALPESRPPTIPGRFDD